MCKVEEYINYAMKVERYNIRYFRIIALIIFTNLSCYRDSENIEPVSRNKIFVEVNGKSWDSTSSNGVVFTSKSHAINCSSSSTNNNRASIYLYRYYTDKNGVKDLLESLLLGAIPFRQGTFNLSGSHINSCNPDAIPSIFYVTNAYDVTVDEYVVAPKYQNTIKITKADTLNKFIEGSIEATMYRIRKDGDSLYLDTLRIKNTVFSMYIEK